MRIAVARGLAGVLISEIFGSNAGYVIGVPHQFRRYDGTGHGYMYQGTSNYRPASARDSWAMSFEFLAGLRLAPEGQKVAAGRR